MTEGQAAASTTVDPDGSAPTVIRVGCRHTFVETHLPQAAVSAEDLAALHQQAAAEYLAARECTCDVRGLPRGEA